MTNDDISRLSRVITSGLHGQTGYSVQVNSSWGVHRTTKKGGGRSYDNSKRGGNLKKNTLLRTRFTLVDRK